MSSVDDRIVNMQFNNKQFVSGATESKRSLEDLERTIANTGKSQGLTNMGSAVDGVKARFSALQVVGVTALANIANSAINSAKTFMTQFSGMQSMMDGFQEYELKLGSIQTIKANTGESLKSINSALNELNTYSDKTIYNFADMTKNIGLFTNAGIGLQDATNMIQGFSNEAAVSGTNAAQAAGAAYQLSQALSAGTIRLMDWRSLQNVGMGNKKMQTGLIDLATAMGKFEGDTETAQLAAQNFNGSLEKNWLSADVMSNYLMMKAGKLSEAQMKNLGLSQEQIKYFQKEAKIGENAATKVRTWTQLVGTVKEQLGSGWAQSMELIIGDFNQATKLFTKINDVVGGVIGKMSDNRNKMLKEWANEGGRDMVLDSFGRIATSLGGIFKAIGGAFRDVFPPSSENLILRISEGFDSFTKKLVASEDTLENVRSIFAAVFSVFKIGAGIIGGIVMAFGKLFGVLFQGTGGANLGIMDLIANVADVITGFQKWLTESAHITDVLGTIGTIAGQALKPIVSIISAIGQAFMNLISGQGLDGFLAPFEGLKGTISKLIADLFGSLGDLFSPFEKLSGVFDGLQVKFEAFASKFGYVADVSDTVSSGVGRLEGTFGSVTKTLAKSTAAGEGLSEGFDKIKGATDSAKTAVSDFVGVFKGSGGVEDASVQLAAAGDTAASRWAGVRDTMAKVGDVIKGVFSALGDAAGWVKKQFSDLFGGMDAIEWASLMNALFTGATIMTIRRFSIDIMKFVKSTLGMLDTISGTFEQLTGTLKTMQNEVRSRMIMNIAIAVGILAASVIALSFIPMEKLQRGLGALAVVMGVLAGTLFAISKMPAAEMSLVGIGVGMMFLATGILALSAAVIMLGKQDLNTLYKGLAAVAIALGLLVVAANMLHKIEGKLISAGIAMMLMGVALTVLAGAIAIFGKMNLNTLYKGFASMAVGLTLMVVALGILQANGKGVLAAAASIMIVAQAMVVLAGVVAAFGNMDLATLAKGFISLAIGLGLMVVALAILAPMAPQVFVVAQAMAILSAAMIGLAIAVGMFGNMDISTLAIGFAAVAVGLTLLIVAAAAAMYVAPGLAILSTSLMMLGAAMALAGLGMALFSAGLATMVALGVAGVAVITMAIQAFLALLPSIAVQVAAAFVAFLKTIAAASPKIRKAMGEIIKNMIGVIRDAIPEFGAVLEELILEGIRVVESVSPRLIELGFQIIDDFITEAEKKVPDIVETGGQLIIKLIEGISDQFEPLAEAAAKSIIKFIRAITAAIENNDQDLRDAGLDMAWAIANGLSGGLLGEGLQMVKDAAWAIADSLPGWMKKVLGIASPSKVTTEIGVNVARGLAVGIAKGAKGAVQAAVDLANAIISAGNEAVAAAQKLASDAQRKADASAARAAITAKKAQQARKAAEKFAKKNPKQKEEIKERNKEVKALENLLTKQNKAADKNQKAADRLAQKVVDTRTFEEADLLGKASIKEDRAVMLSDRASQMLAKANAEAREAKKLMETNKKAGREMLKQARKDAAEAKRLAKLAKAANAEANAFYAQEVEGRLKQLREDAAYDAADDKGKAAILDARAKANDAKAEAAKKAAASLASQAEAVMATNAAEAYRLIGLAEQAAQEARDAASAAEQQRQQAEQLLNPQTTPTTPDTTTTPTQGTGGDGPTILQPSRTALEDAARSIDRYTASLRQAEEMAGAQQGVIQFVQHNNSPKALSAPEIYRQSKNLLSAAEIKMGAISATNP